MTHRKPLPVTADAIRSAAYEFNAAYPEAAAEIAAGTPVLDVRASSDGRTGRTITVVISAVVTAEDGGTIGTGLATVITIPRRDGRLSPAENARRALHSRFVGVTVPIEYTSIR